MVNDTERSFAAVGEGVLDFSAIISAGETVAFQVSTVIGRKHHFTAGLKIEFRPPTS